MRCFHISKVWEYLTVPRSKLEEIEARDAEVEARYFDPAAEISENGPCQCVRDRRWLLERVREMRGALMFYERSLGLSKSLDRRIVHQDGGERARNALAHLASPSDLADETPICRCGHSKDSHQLGKCSFRDAIGYCTCACFQSPAPDETPQKGVEE